MNISVVRNLLVLLTCHEYCSGEWLGQQLGVSRAAIWKQIQSLSQLGIEVSSVKGRGYRLYAPVALFDESRIKNVFEKDTDKNVHLITCLSTDSTNDLVKKKVSDHHKYTLCVADHQVMGRGRRGRVWKSPLGTNCYYSLSWKSNKGFSALEGLSLVVGLALIDTLKNEKMNGLQLKWPNDVLWYKKKLSGILLELDGDANGECRIIIGIGINLHLSEQVRKTINQQVADLHEITGKTQDKNKLVALLTNRLINYLSVFEQQGFSPFKDRWNHYDAFINKPVIFSSGDDRCTGIDLGVNDRGTLLIKTDQGVEMHSGGEISLRLY